MRRRLIVTAIAAAVATLALLEVAVRALGVAPPAEALRIDVVLPGPKGITQPVGFGFIPGATIRTTYASGEPVDHVFNSAGWRDAERTVEKPAGTFRILGLGDSYLYGQGVASEDVCLRRLEARLAAARPEMRFEAINTGISGMNTAAERDLLRFRGLSYAPDLVILCFVPNDVEEEADLYREGPKVEFYDEYVTLVTEPDALSEVSALWRWGRGRWLERVRGRAYLDACLASYRDDDAKWARCRQALGDIESTCRDREIGLLVVLFPFFVGLDGDYPFQPIHDAVRGFCESRGIAVLDLRDAYAAFEGQELWVHPTDPHPSARAHAIAGEAMAAYLLENDALLTDR